jgi:YHS domain-containing protein
MAPSERVFDPICGMWIEAGCAELTLEYIGQTYAFCCAECRDLFARAPERQVARLAHEPGQSAGYCCPNRRRSASSAEQE